VERRAYGGRLAGTLAPPLGRNGETECRGDGVGTWGVERVNVERMSVERGASSVRGTAREYARPTVAGGSLVSVEIQAE
jgi:hypothetical protein